MRPLRFDVSGREQVLGLAPLRGRRQHDGRPLAPGASGAAAAVDQRVGVQRQVGVNDQVHVGQVDPAGGDVGGDQHAGFAAAKLVERAVAFGLGAIARDGGGGEPARGQGGVHLGDPLAGLAKDDRPFAGVGPQHVDDGGQAVARGDQVGAVGDVVVRPLGGRAPGAVAAGIDRQRVALVSLGEGPDLRRQRRREHQRPACLRRRLQDGLQILAEAEVQHLVGLVEHDHPQRGQVQALAPHRIDEPAGGTDHQLDAALKRLQIAADRGAAGERGEAGTVPWSSQRSSSRTCVASSRVGAITSAIGERAVGDLGRISEQRRRHARRRTRPSFPSRSATTRADRGSPPRRRPRLGLGWRCHTRARPACGERGVNRQLLELHEGREIARNPRERQSAV